jgi:asparagine synthase (glutamine-hydrolysing)
MCGIVGVLSRERPIERATLERATDALHNRGPDGAGHWQDATCTVGLGHRRLGLVDREGGAQPLRNEDGTVHVVVNGELYDAAALRTDLERRGHRFATRSDSELLVHLYEEHGVAALDHLRGEFAFVLWDAGERRLVAARDRFGVKPLCWTEHGGALWIASQAKALFAAGVPAAWDVGSLEQAARMQYTLPGSTLFRGVHELAPGHVLIAHAGAVSVRAYWDLSYPAQATEPAEPVAEFRALLDDAVAVRLVADVPPAFHLSGGIDSSSVAAIAARALGTIDCFTVSFDDARYDELALAREVATAIGARHHVVHVSADAVVQALPAAVVAGEGLAINGHLAAKFLLSRAVHGAGFKFALTGEGADEVLGGYAHLRVDLGQADLLASNTASRGIMLPDGAALSTDAVQARLGFVPTWLRAKATLGRRMQAILAEPAAGIDAYATFLAGIDVDGQLAGRGRVEQSLYLWCKSALEGYILRTLGDGMEMAHSVEGRLPFLDSRLFEWLRTCPLEHKIRGTREKSILRDAMRGDVPASVLDREKHPFLAPPAFSGPLAGLLQDLLGGRAAQSLPVFDARRLRAELGRVQKATAAEQVAWDPVFFLALSACILHERMRLGA